MFKESLFENTVEGVTSKTLRDHKQGKQGKNEWSPIELGVFFLKSC